MNTKYLVGDGHVALLLGHAGDRSAVAHLGRLLALHDGKVGLGLDDLVAAVRGRLRRHCALRVDRLVLIIRLW